MIALRVFFAPAKYISCRQFQARSESATKRAADGRPRIRRLAAAWGRARSAHFLAGAFLFSAPLRAAPALKRAFFDAAILISLPVAGLRPLPAARSRTEKVPKPTRRTSSPFLSDLATPS